MQQEKTVLEWLEQAKAQGYVWADAAIENHKKSQIVHENSLATSLSAAIGGGFSWGSSSEGIKYWEGIYTGLFEKEISTL